MNNIKDIEIMEYYLFYLKKINKFYFSKNVWFYNKLF